jgi:hypothetical protein
VSTRATFEDKPPIIPAPYDSLCGAISWPDDQIIPEGSYVCARNMQNDEDEDAQYFLVYVIGFDREKVISRL